MLSRLVCRRNRGANGSKNAASSGSASGEALGTLLIFMLHSTTETNKVVLEHRSRNAREESTGRFPAVKQVVSSTSLDQKCALASFYKDLSFSSAYAVFYL